MLDPNKLQMFRNRFTKVYKHVGKLARRQNIGCYRVYDHDIPEFPFCIERYEDNVYVAEYRRNHGMTDEEHDAWLDECLQEIATLLETTVDKIYVKERKRKENRDSQYQRVADAQNEFVVMESELKFKVNLSDYLDTGLFLDHRITRGMVQQQCKGKDVLNLFCYTGSFSVYAGAGEANTVTSVDLSKTYLNWLQENLQLNNLFDEKKQMLIHADVLQYLQELKPNSFDIIILDPPTFSNSKRMKDFLDIQRDHVELINNCLYTLRPGGILYFSTNSRRFEMERELINSTQIKDITKATTPFDFEGKLFRWCFEIKVAD
jgi:23S rRNA (cytosine1962-C5)-methyltransferase